MSTIQEIHNLYMVSKIRLVSFGYRAGLSSSVMKNWSRLRLTKNDRISSPFSFKSGHVIYHIVSVVVCCGIFDGELSIGHFRVSVLNIRIHDSASPEASRNHARDNELATMLHNKLWNKIIRRRRHLLKLIGKKNLLDLRALKDVFVHCFELFCLIRFSSSFTVRTGFCVSLEGTRN